MQKSCRKCNYLFNSSVRSLSNIHAAIFRLCIILFMGNAVWLLKKNIEFIFYFTLSFIIGSFCVIKRTTFNTKTKEN